MAKEEFDLRKLKPQKGDLVLLVDEDIETGKLPLLLVFEKFLYKISDSREIGVTLLGDDKCHIEASEAIYLEPQRGFDNYQYHFTRPQELSKSKIKYNADIGYLGVVNTILALKEMKGYLAYADLLSAQSKYPQS